jgi:MoxR-like ATPase
MTTAPPSSNDLSIDIADACQLIRAELSKAIIGQHEVVGHVLLALICGEHALLTGVPGLAKTLLIRSLSETLHLDFNRIQFTPDLMPSDITGTEIIEEDPATGRRERRFLKGPVFTNLLLADEINRTPPRTQAAMLQTMQERQVTAGGETRALPKPFHVFATQNPIEQEGTYPLPEAAADRFMLSIEMGYPSIEEEIAVVTGTTGNLHPKLIPKLSGERLIEIQRGVRAVPVSRDVVDYAVRLVAASRPDTNECPAGLGELLRWGAGPRASQYLILGAKGRAAMEGRPCADFAGVRAVAHEVLSHRILPSFKARTKNVETREILQRIFDATPESR